MTIRAANIPVTDPATRIVDPRADPVTEPITIQRPPDPGPPTEHGSDPTGDGPRPASRWWLSLVFLLALIAFAGHDAGQLTFDTKLGVNIDPVGFYQRLGHLWNPLEWFGGLQDQYIGYAFPMGTFYLLGHLLAVPVWLVQRLWMALLVAVGFWGLVRLGEALRIGGPRSRLLAGALFALWPTYTILIGSTSAAVLPGMLAPWAVLPMVAASRDADDRPVGRWRSNRSPRVAAVRSGLVVLAMGGVNAVSTLAALALPGLFILTRTDRGRRWSLLAWWVPSVVLATSWWLIPLLFQGRYGFNFLPYIEQAANTTQTMSASAVLRGSGNWVAYLHLGSTWLAAGWTVVSSPVVVAAAAVAAAAGLYGLARRDLPEGRWLRLATGVAALVALAGYPGLVGGLFHGTVQHLLDGALAPLRNVYKFEPVLAATLALGAAHGLAHLPDRATAGVSRPPTGRLPRLAAGVLALVVLVGLALPYLTAQVLQSGSFSSVPSYWTQAADYLQAHSPTESAMVVPADSHGTYTWGTPIDDPLEPLAKSPWVQRGLVPFSGPGSQAVLDTAEQAIESGARVPGLAAFLSRAGVRYLVVRNDLDPQQIDYTPPRVVHQTLQQSGFHRVASFGPPTTGGFIYPNTPLPVQGLVTSYPAVEIFQAPQDEPVPFGPVASFPANSATTVNGDPATLLQLADQGVLGSQPVIMAGDSTGTGSTPDAGIVTDGNQRQDHSFGLIQHNASYTYTPTETNPVDDPHGAGGQPPRQLLANPKAPQTVAQLTGAASVTSSSYGSWLWEMPQFDPVNAFDQDPTTAWTEGQATSGVGQWLQIDFDRPVDLPTSSSIQLLDDSAFRPLITKLTAKTDTGTADTQLAATGDSQTLQLPPGPTRSLRLTIDTTTGGLSGGPGAGIRDVNLGGVSVTRYLRPAQDAATGNARDVTFSFHQDTNPPLSLATASPEPRLARVFDTGGPLDLGLSGSVVGVPGGALDELLDRYRPQSTGLTVTASSTWGSLPQFRAANLVDGSYQTGWLAGGPNPTVHLSWHGTRTLDQLVLSPAGGLSTGPARVHISTPNGSRDAAVPADGTVHFPALTTDQMDISFPVLHPSSTFNPSLGQPTPLLVGLAELYVPALADLRAPQPAADTPLNLPCGAAPSVQVDGQTYQTSVTGTVGELTGFQPMAVHLCNANGKVHLNPGRHYLSSAGSGPLTLTDLALTNAPPVRTAAARTRPVRVMNWQSESRQVAVDPGDTSYLEVHEAFNNGWTASLNGHRLTPVQLDGWQQGFVVPAGNGGVVDLWFTPQAQYRLALIGSAIGVGLLAVAALIPGRVRRNRPRREHRAGMFASWLALVAVAVLFVIIGGVAAVLVPILAVLGYLRPRWLPWLAGGAMLAAGVSTVIGLAQHGVGYGSSVFGPAAQVFALAALAAALTPRLRRHTEQET